MAAVAVAAAGRCCTMPTNLPPEYYDAEERFREARLPEEKLECLEEMLTTVPKHKGTDHLRADLRRKLSKLKEASESKKGKGKHESVYHVEREGAGRVAVIGAPNVGKSALVAALTHATPKVSEYPFTTWSPLPGMMPVRDIQIQLIDTPALSTEHVEHELFGLIRTAEMVLLVVDVQTSPILQLEKTVAILADRRTPLRDAHTEVPEGMRHPPMRTLVLANKCDEEQWDEDYGVVVELLEGKWPIMPVSSETGRNLETLKETVFDWLQIMRVYSKIPGKDADMSAPFVLKRGGTVLEFAAKVHKDFAVNLKTARIWGTGVHDGQMVGRDHELYDGDIVELRTGGGGGKSM